MLDCAAEQKLRNSAEMSLTWQVFATDLPVLLQTASMPPCERKMVVLQIL